MTLWPRKRQVWMMLSIRSAKRTPHHNGFQALFPPLGTAGRSIARVIVGRLNAFCSRNVHIAGSSRSRLAHNRSAT